MAYTTLQYEVADSVAHVTLDRPEAANALDRAMGAELRDVAIDLYHRSDVRAVLLTAKGKVFCGGGDLASFAQQDHLPAYVDQVTVDFHAALSRFSKMDAPLVAAVAGSAGGAGMSLVAACDLVVAGRSSKFTMGYTRAGMVPDGTSSFFLARVVGLRRAMDLVLTNRVLDAATAEQWGLVNRVVDDAVVEEEARALATQLASGATRSFGLAKRLLLEGASSSLEESYERESLAIAQAAGSADGAEGIAAFLGKRRPDFQGR